VEERERRTWSEEGGCGHWQEWEPGPELDSDTPAMTLNLVSNYYLEESTAKIRAKQVPWEVRLWPDNLPVHHLWSVSQVGISTRRTCYTRGACAHQESRQAA
jgi:hypothetical protein